MKHINIFSTFIILTGLYACGEPPVTFNEPQPTDTENHRSFLTVCKDNT